ncbi:hypothetical protein HPP92_004268 [Vanilla planifolia]|uniref:RNase III domain-containing protein n=1 Tax=Vanilla planifolia TaxID=51239 RepID=A0A835RQ34_VANPL|nr:hypothetical protein HPP92_004711 [Vanilla planifolia]KAG0493274.1 hypothetical protein HPP92_004268 [Vanilla planifolia]
MPMPGLQFLSLCVSALVFVALQVSTAVSNSSATYPDFETLQKQIEYQFHSVDLLRQAMTHPSYSIENNHALSLLGLHAIESAAALRLLSTDRVATAADVEAQIKKITSKDACVSGAKGLLLEKLVRVARGPTPHCRP